MFSSNFIQSYEDFKRIVYGENGRKNKFKAALIACEPLRRYYRDNYSVSRGYEGSPFYNFVRRFVRDKTASTMADSMFRDFADGYDVVLMGYAFQSSLYHTDDWNGLCEDGDTNSVRYVRKEDGRVFKMKFGKMMLHLLNEHECGRLLPESVKNLICEEVTEKWRLHCLQNGLSQYDLVVDDDFAAIYDRELRDREFGSCMSGRNQHSFYSDSLEGKCKAASIRDKSDGSILARCVVFTHCENTETGEVYRLAERQYSAFGNIEYKRALIAALIAGGHIDGYKAFTAGCGDANAFFKNDGSSLSNLKLKIQCHLDDGDTISYQDSFKWYSQEMGEAYNFDPSPLDTFNLSTTDDTFNEPENNWDEWHSCYTSSDVVTVRHNGQEYTCDENRLDDFFWREDDDMWVHRDNVKRCERCGNFYDAYEGGHYSDLTECYYCSSYCMGAAEGEYKQENWYWCEYDCSYVEDEEDVCIFVDSQGDETTVSRDYAEYRVRRDDWFEWSDGKFHREEEPEEE